VFRKIKHREYFEALHTGDLFRSSRDYVRVSQPKFGSRNDFMNLLITN
jgi:hypothetical protein